MPQSVPTWEEFQSLEARVAALEGSGPPPPDPTVPPVGSDVLIAAGTTRGPQSDWDVSKIDVFGNLTYPPDKSVTIRCLYLNIKPGGRLVMQPQPGIKHQIVFADVPGADSRLFIEGNVLARGQDKTPFAQLGFEALAGDTVITLVSVPSNWAVGDKLAFPDTRQLREGEREDKFVPQWETGTIAMISSDGHTVTLAAPLKFTHPAWREEDGTVGELPEIGNLTHSIVIKSEKAGGWRGCVYVTGTAVCDLEGVQFGGLGRTLNDPADTSERYPIYVENHTGTFRMHRCSDFCPLDPMPFRWGLAINWSNTCSVTECVFYNWMGAGIAETNSRGNLFDGNLVIGILGDRNPFEENGMDGSGFWAKNSNSRYVRCIAASCYDRYGGGSIAGVGFNFMSNDPAHPINEALLQFEDCKAIACSWGLTLWRIGADGVGYNAAQPLTVIKNFKAWHCYRGGYFSYPINNVQFAGFKVYADWGSSGVLAWCSGDYMAANVSITDSDVRGCDHLVYRCTQTPERFTVSNCFADTRGPAIVWTNLGTPGMPNAPKYARELHIDGLRFTNPVAIQMEFDPENYHGGRDYTQLDQVFVTNLNGVSGDNFQVYYLQQAPDYIMPQTIYYGPDDNNDGVPDWYMDKGCPEVGLTNAQAWQQYGIAIAGAVSPTNVTRPEIMGFVRAM